MHRHTEQQDQLKKLYLTLNSQNPHKTKPFTECEHIMKVKLHTLFDAHPAFEFLAQQFFSISHIAKIGNLIDAVNGQYIVIATKQEELLAFYGTKNADGKFDIEDEKKAFYEKELAEFLDTEIEIDWNPIKIEELGLVVRMPIVAYRLLEGFFLPQEAEILV